MKALLHDLMGKNHILELKDVATPVPREDEVLVKVRAFALNRADLLQLKGKYPPPPGESEILGLELAGDVVEVGSTKTKIKVGDRVFGLVGGGAYAEYCLLKTDLAMPLPQELSYTEAAAIPEAFFTANEILFTCGKLKAGENVLIQAGGSGIGTTAIQMAKLEGATVHTTVGSEMKRRRVIREIGADFAYDYQAQNFDQDIAPQLAGKLDLILDVIGANYIASHIAMLREKGRMVCFATMGGRNATLDLSEVLSKRLNIQGFVLRRQSVAEKSQIAQRFQQKWLPLIVAKKIRPIIDRVFHWSDIADAHAFLESRQSFGKVVVEIK